MGKFLIVFISLLLAICKPSSSTDIMCDYDRNGNYQSILGYIYQCEVKYNPNIETKEEATITAITGFHRSSVSDQSVLGIRAESKTLKYFPQGMEKIFKNLQVIDFYSVGMVEVHQSDLKPFPDLVVLYLGHNKIETLEAGLFDHNPKLLVIAFPYNGIKHISGNIFDHLSQLSRFWFKGNDCIDTEFNSRHEISTAIEYVKEHCAPDDEKTVESEEDDNLFVHTHEDLEEYGSDEETELNGGSGRRVGSVAIVGVVAVILHQVWC